MSELLSPAGSLKMMHYAFAYGADAVYAGQPRYSLRVRNNEFTIDKLSSAINYAHSLGKKFYVVVNIAAHNAKLGTFISDLEQVLSFNPDALIMSDPGLIMLAKDSFPSIPIHLSVQSNAINWATVKFWHKQGISRVILSRELTISEIREIRQLNPDIELEIFIHGALCIAYSGRCLLSGYINHRDSNQGACSNVCRWRYNLSSAFTDSSNSLYHHEESVLGIGVPSNEAVILEDQSRPGQFMPAFEDQHGTYILNSRDLRALEHIHELVSIGVNSLKIEGRTKSFYYCARTSQVYRRAIDLALSGLTLDPSLFSELDHLSNRGYTDGFLRKQSISSHQNYDSSGSKALQQQFVGEFTGLRKNSLAEVIVKNRFTLEDRFYFISPKHNTYLSFSHFEDERGNSLSVAPGSGYTIYVDLPADLPCEYSLLTKVFQ